MRLLPKRLTLSQRIVLMYSIIFLIVISVFSALLSILLLNMYKSGNENDFISATDFIENHMKMHKSFNPSDLEYISLSNDIVFNIYYSDGKLAYSNKPDFPALGVKSGEKGLTLNERNIDRDTHIVYLNKNVIINNKSYYIQVARALGDFYGFPKRFFNLIRNTIIFGIIICILSGLYLSRKTLKPIRSITNTVKELNSKSLDKRITMDASDAELKNLSIVLNSMLERLEEDFEKQRRFVYDASHELRTPLSVIYGNINMLTRWGKDNPEVLAKALSTLKHETENMNKLIENLLFLARHDSNRYTLKKEIFSLNTLLEEVVDETMLVHIDYSVTKTCHPEFLLNADYNAIKQVLRILLDNSIKYSTPPGSINIKGERTNNGTLICVSDKGCGIPQEALPYIFDRFYRVDESRTKATGGTGLGLSIAKQIVSSHNGKISVTSELGRGTEFEIFIP